MAASKSKLSHLLDISAYRNSIDAKEWMHLNTTFLFCMFKCEHRRNPATLDELNEWVNNQDRNSFDAIKDQLMPGWLLARWLLAQEITELDDAMATGLGADQLPKQ